MFKFSKRLAVVMPTVAEDRSISAAAKADDDAQPLTSKQLQAMVPMKSYRERFKSYNGAPTTLLAAILFVSTIGSALAQSLSTDLADQALISALQRDRGSLLCVGKGGSLKDLREILNPYIVGIDLSDKNSYPTLARAVYTAFPCPFSPDRSELRPATKDDIVGDWLFPETSMKLRHGPQSKFAALTPGVPPLKCEVVLYGQTGTARVTQMRGQLPCSHIEIAQLMNKQPIVASWSTMHANRIKVSRTDVPTHFEEWEMFVVEKSFDIYGVHFDAGDLLAYMRREPGNDIGAATTFRHLQRMK